MAKNKNFPPSYYWLTRACFLLHKGKSNVGRDKDQQKIINYMRKCKTYTTSANFTE